MATWWAMMERARAARVPWAPGSGCPPAELEPRLPPTGGTCGPQSCSPKSCGPQSLSEVEVPGVKTLLQLQQKLRLGATAANDRHQGKTRRAKTRLAFVSAVLPLCRSRVLCVSPIRRHTQDEKPTAGLALRTPASGSLLRLGETSDGEATRGCLLGESEKLPPSSRPSCWGTAGSGTDGMLGGGREVAVARGGKEVVLPRAPSVTLTLFR